MIRKLLLQFRELWAYPALCISLIATSIFAAKHILHRPTVQDPDAIVGFAYNVGALFFIAIFVVTVDSWLFHDMSKEEWKKASSTDKILDVCKTLILFGLSVWFVRSA